MSTPSVWIRRTERGRPWRYRALDECQREIATRVRAGQPGVVLISEVNPVITLGLRAEEARDLTVSPVDALVDGVEVFRTDRGGRATYHGPGQWLVFPVDSLESMVKNRRGVRMFTEGLLDCATVLAKAHGAKDVTPFASGDRAGVWASGKKIASMGIRVDRGVVQHGLSLNVYPREKSFYGTRPCGENPDIMGYLYEEFPGEDRFEAIGAELRDLVLKKFWL